MSFSADASTIRTRLNTLWSTGDGPLLFENVGSTAPDFDTWIRLSIREADTDQESMGPRGATAGTYRLSGLVMVQVFAPVGEGDGEARRLADKVSNIFRGVHISSGGRQMFFGSPSVVPVGIDGKWFHANVLCPWSSYGTESTTTST